MFLTKKMGDVVLLMDESSGGCNKKYYCRICHEGEFQSYNNNTLEAPCSCSGTLKVRLFFYIYNNNNSVLILFFDHLQFAHRECIQNWCNQKGNTTCEICLQVPSYTN